MIKMGSSEIKPTTEGCVVLSTEEALSILRAMNPKPEDRKWRDLLKYRITGYMPIHSTPMTGKLIIRDRNDR